MGAVPELAILPVGVALSGVSERDDVQAEPVAATTAGAPTGMPNVVS